MKKDDTQIFHIVRSGKLDLYRKHIEEIDINIRSKDGQSLLHKAIAHAQTEIALDLLERSIDANTQDLKGQTALHYLGFHPNTLLAKRIIEKGGKLDLKDAYGNTPLWYAVFNARGKYELVEFLVGYGANPSLKNNAGRSPIDFAIQIKDEKLISVLQKI